jgi:hypothetical protein
LLVASGVRQSHHPWHQEPAIPLSMGPTTNRDDAQTTTHPAQMHDAILCTLVSVERKPCDGAKYQAWGCPLSSCAPVLHLWHRAPCRGGEYGSRAAHTLSNGSDTGKGRGRPLRGPSALPNQACQHPLPPRPARQALQPKEL